MYSFFAMLSRMKYIDRWSLMRNSWTENISEHSHEVAVLAHALAMIGNLRLGKQLNAERAALLGLYHDTTEILTGDMPTPVKYNDTAIREAYRHLEDQASQALLDMLPDDMAEEYASMFYPKPEDAYLWKLVKAADKLSALIKCIEESKVGNREFVQAEASTREKLNSMTDVAELKIFMDEFLQPYGRSLDEM